MKKKILGFGICALCCLGACNRLKQPLPTLPQETTSVESVTQESTESTTTQEAMGMEIVTKETIEINLPTTDDKEVARENLQAVIDAYLPGIVCWGDSLTLGMGGNASYPDVVRQLINEEILAGTGCEIPVINMGIGVEDSATITARACGMPMTTIEEFTIPAQCVNVQFNFRNEEGQILEPIIHGTTGIEYVEICGVRGTLEFLPDVAGVSGGKFLYYFKRLEAGEEVKVPAGTKIYTNGYMEYKKYLPIIFMGENGGYADLDQLMRQQVSIINANENAKGYLIIGLTTGTAAEREPMEIAMQEKYGKNYLNARQIISKDGAALAEIETTVFDQWMTDEGKIPGRLLSDSVHFNGDGYRVLGMLVYNQLKELGYFDEIIEEVQNYRKFQ